MLYILNLVLFFHRQLVTYVTYDSSLTLLSIFLPHYLYRTAPLKEN